MPETTATSSPSQDENKVLTRNRDVYFKLLERWRTRRTESELSFQFLKGIQWEKKITDDLDNAGLPWLTLNIMLPIFLRIIGAERQGRSKLKAVPLKDATMEIGDIFTKLFDWIEHRSDMADEFGKAFATTVIGDIMGWVECVYSHEFDPLGEPRLRFVNPFFVLLGECEREDLSDCRELIKTFMITKEELKDLFPEHADELDARLKRGSKNFLARINDSLKEKFGAEKHREEEFRDERLGLYRVVELYERNTQEEIFTIDDDNNLIKLKPGEAEKLKTEQPERKIRRKKKEIITVTTTAANLVVLQPKTPLKLQNGSFPLFPVWGLNFDGDNMGLARHLRSPQEEYNKARSSELHILNTTANSGWHVPDDMDEEEVNKLESRGGMSGLILKYRSQKAEKILPNQIPPGMVNRAREARDDAQFISSVSENSLGRRESSGESGKLFQSRVEEFLSTLATFFLNLRKTQKRVGIYFIDMIQQNMRTERVIQITGADGQLEDITLNQTIPFTDIKLNDVSIGKFGVTVEASPTTQIARRELVNLLVQTLQYAPPEVAPVIVKTIFEKLEIPEKERMEIVQQLQSLIPPSAAEQLQGQQLAEQLNEPAQAIPFETT